MSIHQAAVASRQSHFARQFAESRVPTLVLSVDEYTAAEADQIVRQAQVSAKIAGRFLSHINSKQRNGWRLDKFHHQLRELCVLTLQQATPRNVVRTRPVEYRVTKHAATALN